MEKEKTDIAAAETGNAADTMPGSGDESAAAPGSDSRAAADAANATPGHAAAAAPAADKKPEDMPPGKSAFAGKGAAMPGDPEAETPPSHDYEAEINELLEAHPEVRENGIPDEVFRTCTQTGKAMLSAYDAYLLRRMNSELLRLRAENETLRQNADNALRAPVSAASGGGVSISPEDPFLSGFYSVG